MTKQSQFAIALALMMFSAVPGSVCAQRGAGQGKPRKDRVEKQSQQKAKEERRAEKQANQQQKAERQGRGQEFQPGRPGAEPPPFLQRLREMSPSEQQRFLENNPRFRNMPRDRQDQIRQNLRRWNAMTPD
ncbi:MAG: DUF3106 domain-containing protein, partial [Acidobacteria bacterium]|nr:DUF3106 domain-containing protein [Acidobacteriota bacterium]